MIFELTPDGISDHQVPYTRASTLGKALSDEAGLTAWKTRLTAYGVATRPDLAARAATAGVEDRAALSEVVNAAMEVAEASSAARLGTATHSATETIDLGGSLRDVPEIVRPQVEAYAALTKDIEVLDVEFFTVNDHLQAAGSPDRLVRLPDGRVAIFDLKTGGPDAVKYGAGEWAVQLACYSTGARYDPETGHRSVIHPDLNPTVGVVAHVPARGGTPALYTLNLTWGLEAARLANRVRAFRRTRFATPWPTQDN